MQTKSKFLIAVVATFASMLSFASKAAQNPEGWQTWTWDGNCFALLYAKPDANGMQTSDTYISVKHLPKERNFDNVAIVSGLGDLTGARATIEIADAELPLLVWKNAGFVRSGDPEKKLIDLMAKNKLATVTWFSKEGMITQTYDLTGFAEAKRKIDLSCPRPGEASTLKPPSEDDGSDKKKKK